MTSTTHTPPTTEEVAGLTIAWAGNLPAQVKSFVRDTMSRYGYRLQGHQCTVEYFEPYTLDGPFVLQDRGPGPDPRWRLTVTYQFEEDAPDRMEESFLVEVLRASYEHDGRLDRKPLALSFDEETYRGQQVTDILHALAQEMIQQRETSLDSAGVSAKGA